MSDMLATASTWLDNTLRTSVSQTVRYKRGGDYVDVPATLRTPDDQAESSPEVRRTKQQSGFEVDVADLVISGQEVEPQKGDKIEYTVNQRTSIFEVLPDEVSGKVFGFCDDTTKNRYLIHTKEVG